MDPVKRICELVGRASSQESMLPMPIDKYMQFLNELFQLGTAYANEGDQERAFVLFLRFVSIAVEELPNNGWYSNLTANEQVALDRKTIQAMTIAEILKTNIRKRYDLEAQLASATAVENVPSTSVEQQQQEQRVVFGELGQQMLSHPDWSVSEEQLRPFVLCHDISIQPIVFKSIILPSNLPQTFQKGRDAGFTFSFLYGKLMRNSLIVSHIVFSPFDESSVIKFKHSLYDADTDTEMPIVGCVCTSLAQLTLSRFFERCQLPELICVLYPSQPNRNQVFHLTNMNVSWPYKTKKLKDADHGCSHLRITESVSAVVYKSQNDVQ